MAYVEFLRLRPGDFFRLGDHCSVHEFCVDPKDSRFCNVLVHHNEENCHCKVTKTADLPLRDRQEAAQTPEEVLDPGMRVFLAGGRDLPP